MGGDVRKNRLDCLRVGTFLSFFHFLHLSGRRAFNTNESHTGVAAILEPPLSHKRRWPKNMLHGAATAISSASLPSD